MTKKNRYTARYEFEDGDWIVEVVEIPEVHSFGRTLAKAQEHVRDALGLWLRVDIDVIDVIDDFSALGSELERLVHDATAARAKAAALSTEAQELTAAAARQLVKERKMPVRDAARLLGVSHQRVHQLVAG